MDNVKPNQYGKVAEEIVFEYLKRKGKNPQWIKKGIGDIRIGQKIIEVKGQNEDWEGSENTDRVQNSITISKSEYDFLRTNPNKFEVYVVYRLKYNKDPKYNKPKIAICKGKDLIKQKSQPKTISIKTPFEFWKTIKPITLNKTKYTPSKFPRS